MSFLTEDDYRAVITDADLEDITDLEDSTRILAEDTAVSLATDYLAARYDTENIFNKVGAARHQSVVWACLAISIYLLHQRLHPNAIPDHRVEQHNRAMAWLKGVQAQELNPVGLPVPDEGVKNYIIVGGETKRENRI